MCDVNIATGEVSQFFVDLYLPGIIPVHLVRTYSTSALHNGPLGYGWKHTLALRIVQSETDITLIGYGSADIRVPLPLRPGRPPAWEPILRSLPRP